MDEIFYDKFIWSFVIISYFRVWKSQLINLVGLKKGHYVN